MKLLGTAVLAVLIGAALVSGCNLEQVVSEAPIRTLLNDYESAMEALDPTMLEELVTDPLVWNGDTLDREAWMLFMADTYFLNIIFREQMEYKLTSRVIDLNRTHATVTADMAEKYIEAPGVTINNEAVIQFRLVKENGSWLIQEINQVEPPAS